MKNVLYYFGTHPWMLGDYFWEVEYEMLHKWPRVRDREIIVGGPEGFFDVLMDVYKPESPKGEVWFKQRNNFSMLRIEGSCKSEKAGAFSLFFIQEDLTQDQLKERILSTPMGRKIIEQMPFSVQW